jgi:Tfp pilus assembly protein PilO
VKRPDLSNREQLLAALAIVAVIACAYGFLRFLPANKVIADLTQNVEATRKRLQTAAIPEEPVEDLDQIVAQLEDQERALAATRSQAEAIEQRLAPFDSQDTIVEISQLARETQVRIRVNEAMKVQPQGNVPAETGKNKKTSKKNAKNNAKNKAKPAEDSQNQPLILPETAGWIARMSPGTAFHRPIQRIELEGSYTAIRQFIHGLDALPYQVTVLRLKIGKSPALAPAGYPQTLVSELVLAL